MLFLCELRELEPGYLAGVRNLASLITASGWIREEKSAIKIGDGIDFDSDPDSDFDGWSGNIFHLTPVTNYNLPAVLNIFQSFTNRQFIAGGAVTDKETLTFRVLHKHRLF